MRALETKFSAAGHYLCQIWRQGDVAIYERSLSPEHPAHELELVIIRIKPEDKTPTGSTVPEREAYPSASEWDQLGWSFPIRHRDTILALAEKLLAITKERAHLAREASHRLWRTEHGQGRIPKVRAEIPANVLSLTPSQCPLSALSSHAGNFFYPKETF